MNSKLIRKLALGLLISTDFRRCGKVTTNHHCLHSKNGILMLLYILFCTLQLPNITVTSRNVQRGALPVGV